MKMFYVVNARAPAASNRNIASCIFIVSLSRTGRLVGSTGVGIYDQRKRNAAAAAVWSVSLNVWYTHMCKRRM